MKKTVRWKVARDGTYRVIRAGRDGGILQVCPPGSKSYMTIQTFRTLEAALKRLDEIR